MRSENRAWEYRLFSRRLKSLVLSGLLRIWNFTKGLLSSLQREFRNDSLYILECDCFDDDKGAPIFNLEKPGEARFWCFVQKDGIRSVVTEGDKCFHLL